MYAVSDAQCTPQDLLFLLLIFERKLSFPLRSISAIAKNNPPLEVLEPEEYMNLIIERNKNIIESKSDNDNDNTSRNHQNSEALLVEQNFIKINNDIKPAF